MKKFAKKLRNAFKIYNGKGQKGITGLETAIILIAFVTVASVLGYSVLSAGIFSSERGKETVYAGLEQAKASMQLRGSVYGLAATANSTSLNELKFTLASVLSDETVDFGNVVFNYADDSEAVSDIGSVDGCIATTLLGNGVTDPTSPVLGPNQQMQVSIDTSKISSDGATIEAYDRFTIQVLPSKGASITIQRTLPGDLKAVNDLF